MGSGFRFLFGLLIVAMIAMVGVYTYDIGVAHGLSQSGAVAAAPAVAPGASAPIYYYYPRHWGWGFGFFPILPILFFVFFFGAFRRMWWGGRYRRGCGYGYYGYHDRVPPEFDEWHRRAHNQQQPPPEPTKL